MEVDIDLLNKYVMGLQKWAGLSPVSQYALDAVNVFL